MQIRQRSHWFNGKSFPRAVGLNQLNLLCFREAKAVLLSFISELHRKVLSISWLSSSSSSSFHSSFTSFAVAQKTPWVGWGKALWRLRLISFRFFLRISQILHTDVFLYRLVLGCLIPGKPGWSQGSVSGQPGSLYGSWEGAAVDCPECCSELSWHGWQRAQNLSHHGSFIWLSWQAQVSQNV